VSRRSIRKRRHLRTVRVNGVTFDPASVRITLGDGTMHRGLSSMTYAPRFEVIRDDDPKNVYRWP